MKLVWPDSELSFAPLDPFREVQLDLHPISSGLLGERRETRKGGPRLGQSSGTKLLCPTRLKYSFCVPEMDGLKLVYSEVDYG
jgi:hypothetical protein